MTTNTPQDELRALIRSKLLAGMTPDQATDAIAKLFFRVEDEWDYVDISTWREPDKRRYQRALACYVHRESHTVAIPSTANRAVAAPAGSEEDQ